TGTGVVHDDLVAAVGRGDQGGDRYRQYPLVLAGDDRDLDRGLVEAGDRLGHVQRDGHGDRRLLRTALGTLLRGLRHPADARHGARLRAAGGRRDDHVRADRDGGLRDGRQVDRHDAGGGRGPEDVLVGADAATQGGQRLADPGRAGGEQHVGEGQRAGAGYTERGLPVADRGGGRGAEVVVDGDRGAVAERDEVGFELTHIRTVAHTEPELAPAHHPGRRRGFHRRR